MYIKKLFTLLFTLSAFSINTQAQNKDVYYQIFVRSFADSNGDGIGDINGITQKLDYLSQLGITGIWLTPVNPSPTYHKYDVTNYLDIDPEYGTIQDFKNMVEEAHKRNIKVLMDFVVNHSSSEHPWFRASCAGHPKYKDYYVWSDTATTQGWYYNPLNPSKKYYAFFWERMPDLNMDNKDVRNEIVNAAKFWLTETKIDGFRLDAAQHIYEPNEVVENNEWWTYFRNELTKVKPDLFLLGEIWNKDSIVATYLKTSLNATFNFEISWLINGSVQNKDADNFVNKINNIRKLYSSYNPNYTDATFISNHDQDRYMSTFKNNPAKAIQAFAMLMTLPGMPFLYYGEEIGMRGIFPDHYRREVFPWGIKNKFNTTWQTSIHSTHPEVRTLEEQMQDKNSLYHQYKQLIQLRKASLILQNGDFIETKIVAKQKSVIAFERNLNGKKIVAIFYTGDNDLSVNFNGKIKPVYTRECAITGKKINCKPGTVLIAEVL